MRKFTFFLCVALIDFSCCLSAQINTLHKKGHKVISISRFIQKQGYGALIEFPVVLRDSFDSIPTAIGLDFFRAYSIQLRC